jgi:hypothetical protein
MKALLEVRQARAEQLDAEIAFNAPEARVQRAERIAEYSHKRHHPIA